ncbi:restriction endonuclease subunit S [Metapseudomonas furukawaii]|uniref:restriction endonuclease subunit S n=1 Tax=Metapseudomonas furukawaii TaxID=1149133 RepID=UPI004045B6B3
MSSEWEWVRLGDYCEKIGSGATPKGGKDAYLEHGPFCLIRSQNVYNDGFTPSGLAYISEEQAQKLDSVTVQEGDVLLNITGDSVARVCLALNKFLPARVNQHVAIIRPRPSKLDNRFLRYFLASPYQQGLMLGAAAAGATRNALTKGMIEDFKVPCPALGLQRAISNILSVLDDRISLLRETNAALEAIAQALFKSWFVDFDPVRAKAEGRQPEGMDAATAALFPDSVEESELGLVPKGWHVGTVSDLGEVICGKTPPTSQPENYGGDVPFITIPDMHDRLVVTSTARSLSRAGADLQKKKYLPAGSVCVSCIATPGLVARVSSDAQTNQQINSVVPFEKWGKSFPLFLLRRIGDAVRVSGSGGSVFHNLSKSGFEALKVLLVGQELAQRFDDAVEPLIAKIMENQIQAQILTQLRDTLLPRLISGQLRLPEAEALLEEAM